MLFIFWNRAEFSMLHLISRCNDSNFSISIGSNNSLSGYFSLLKKNQAQLKLVETSYSSSWIQKADNWNLKNTVYVYLTLKVPIVK